MSLQEIEEKLKEKSNPEHAESYRRFFKKNSIEEDQFIGVKVPVLRAVAKQYRHLSFQEIEKLISSPVHEKRLLALYLLVAQMKKDPQSVFDFYLAHKQFVNHWDLVDTSAYKIIGVYLENKDQALLTELAHSFSIWDRRIAIVATWHFIKKKQFAMTFHIAELLMQEREDLIHKAMGWMLREVGKQDPKALQSFLNEHAQHMPKTALRYALEHFKKSF